IFMTFSGTTPGTFTLAHELGHAYHNSVQRDLPAMARGFSMCTAETASTFAEGVVSRAALAGATTKEERLALLDGAIHNVVAMFMNIHARFLFEERLYEARQKGLLGVEQLNGMMEEAQREAYRDGLVAYHPQFWASKGHFYGTGTAFYNFPYTFGFLFSSGIYARAVSEGPGFADKYVGLLRDTGRMDTEELAGRHLGVSLETPEFWNEAVRVAMEPVEEFIAAASQR
ncbi:MAG TPA: M3 family metallopeptidase, partial [Chloroflexota bacterium]|nr:M3 family metallopeptidase [Chloroflexota bacterium]